MKNCIFCKIVRGELPSTKVYEDDEFIAFLDLYPMSDGHCMLIPKEHYVNIFDADPEKSKNVYPRLIELAQAIKKATGCTAMNIIQNNGAEAGQVVFHSHIHLIPRNDGDNLKDMSEGKRQATPEELSKIAAKIIAELEA